MFRNSLTSLLIPQMELARLAAHLAVHWGNESFDRPRVPWESYLTGVLYHDRGFGLLDRHELGVASEVERLRMFHRTVTSVFADPVAEIVIQMHVLRLLSSPPVRAPDVCAEAERVVQKCLESCAGFSIVVNLWEALRSNRSRWRDRRGRCGLRHWDHKSWR